MAMKCSKCDGIIPDVVFGSRMNRNNCKCHIKPEINIDYKKLILTVD